MGTAKRVFASLILLASVITQAAPVGAERVSTTRVLINEIQTELDDANQEFVELVNVSTDDIDLSGWTLQYRAATGTTWTEKAVLSGILYPKGTIVVASQAYLADTASFFWSQAGGVLAATGGNIRLMPANSIAPEDAVAWGTGVYGEAIAAAKAPKGSSLQRKLMQGVPQDTDDNSIDFETVPPSPTKLNVAPVDSSDPSTDPGTVPDTTESDPNATPENPDTIPDPAETTTPDGNTDTDPGGESTVEPPAQDPSAEGTGTSGQEQNSTPLPDATPAPEVPAPALLLPLVINELMIDPASPQTDADDEWVELYNPNSSQFPLDGYRVQTGSTFSHSYTFSGGVVEPYGYVTVYSGASNISLSNSSGAARIMSPEGLVDGQIVLYEESEEGNTYAMQQNGEWLWTTTPTPNGENVFTIKQELIPPLATKTTAPKTSTKTVPKTVAPKVTTVKTATESTKKATSSSSKTTKSTTSQSATVPPTSLSESTPSHPAALAGFGLLAVGYALYEYREDITNKVRIARRYLEARRIRRASL